MISDKYSCIFIHIPKTAGQSIEHFFLNLHGLSWADRAPLLLRYNPDRELGPERLAHLFASEYVGCGHMEEKQFDGYFKFAFVRNPWARLVSEYNYRKYYNLMSFDDFVLNGFPVNNLYTDRYRHIVPQYDFLYDNSGRILVDYVGRFEALQADFDYICSQIGIAGSKLPYVNSSTKGNGYIEYYNDSTIDLVAGIYKKDIENLGYSFGK